MTEKYLGVNVSPLSYNGVIEAIKKRILQGEQSTIIAVNPEKVMAAQRDPQVKELINKSTFQIADGVGILLASKLKGGNISSRVTGVDMMTNILLMSAQEGFPVYFYGAQEEVVVKAIENIKKSYPAIQIAGYTNGYDKDEDALAARIHQSGAQVIFVALGSPKQELWIQRNLVRLPNVKVFQGVGGSFDVFSGTVKRAPMLFRKLGIEWLYRLISEPSRLKRQSKLPVFLMKVIRSK